jgi:hypothetical protein
MGSLSSSVIFFPDAQVFCALVLFWVHLEAFLVASLNLCHMIGHYRAYLSQDAYGVVFDS